MYSTLCILAFLRGAGPRIWAGHDIFTTWNRNGVHGLDKNVRRHIWLLMIGRRIISRSRGSSPAGMVFGMVKMGPEQKGGGSGEATVWTGLDM